MAAKATMTHLFIELVFFGVKFLTFCFARLRSLRLIFVSIDFNNEKLLFFRPTEVKFMKGMALNKLKNKALGVAGSALTRVELASEESRLKTRFQALGQKLYKAVEGDLLSTIKNDPSVVELIGDIEESKRKISDLESKLGGGNDSL